MLAGPLHLRLVRAEKVVPDTPTMCVSPLMSGPLNLRLVRAEKVVPDAPTMCVSLPLYEQRWIQCC